MKISVYKITNMKRYPDGIGMNMTDGGMGCMDTTIQKKPKKKMREAALNRRKNKQ